MSFAYTPDYAFESSSHDSTHESYTSSEEPRATWGIKKVAITGSFLTIHFDSSSEMSTWRGTDRSITLDYTGSGSQDWEGTWDLTSNEEYSVETTYNYIHYDLDNVFGETFNSIGEDLADDLAQNGTGSSVLDISDFG